MSEEADKVSLLSDMRTDVVDRRRERDDRNVSNRGSLPGVKSASLHGISSRARTPTSDTRVTFNPFTGTTEVRLVGDVGVPAENCCRPYMPRVCDPFPSPPEPKLKPAIILSDPGTKHVSLYSQPNLKGSFCDFLQPGVKCKPVRSMSESGSSLDHLLSNTVTATTFLIPETGATLNRMLSETKTFSSHTIPEEGSTSTRVSPRGSPRFFHRQRAQQGGYPLYTRPIRRWGLVQWLRRFSSSDSIPKKRTMFETLSFWMMIRSRDSL